jgi:F0F1-type ATP synthase assembly protein I
MVAAFAVPWIMILAIVGAAIGGLYLDRWLGTSPWLTIGLICLGVGGGGFTAYRSIMKALGGR